MAPAVPVVLMVSVERSCIPRIVDGENALRSESSSSYFEVPHYRRHCRRHCRRRRRRRRRRHAPPTQWLPPPTSHLPPPATTSSIHHHPSLPHINTHYNLRSLLPTKSACKSG